MAYRNASKFRNTVGKEQSKPDVSYGGVVPPSTASVDTCGVAASSAWVAACTSSPGSIALLPLDGVGVRSPAATFAAHSAGGVCDMQFSPHADDLLASGGDDGAAKVWRVNAPGDATQLAARSAKKRVVAVRWHPSAAGVLASAANDGSVSVWDACASSSSSSSSSSPTAVGSRAFDAARCVQSLAWSADGALLAATHKDKKWRTFDVRAGGADSVLAAADAHAGIKTQSLVFVDQCGDAAARFFTTGAGRQREREYRLWDVRRADTPLLASVQYDTSTGVMTPLYDASTRLLVLGGKGDTALRYLELVDTAAGIGKAAKVDILPVGQVSCAGNQLGALAAVPKQALDVLACEVFRCLRMSAHGIAPVTFTVPRKTVDTFVDELYPDTPTYAHALSPAQYAAGDNACAPADSLDPYRRAFKTPVSYVSWATGGDGSSSDNSDAAAPTPEHATTATPEATTTTTTTPTTTPTTPTKPTTTTAPQSAADPPAASTTTTTAAPSLSSSLSSSNASLSSSLSSSNASNASTTPVQVVRSSKYRHIGVTIERTLDLGHTTQKPLTTIDNPVRLSPPDATGAPADGDAASAAASCSLAVALDGNGGRVAVLPAAHTARLNGTLGVLEAGSPVLDLEWSPFARRTLATAHDDGQVLLWADVDRELYARDRASCSTPSTTLRGHTRRVGQLAWHPRAAALLATTAWDQTLRVFDADAGAEVSCVADTGDTLASMSWCPHRGALNVLLALRRDRQLRMYDARARGAVLSSRAAVHGGAKQARACWLDTEHHVLTAGFARTSSRELCVWDVRAMGGDDASSASSRALRTINVDNLSGTLVPEFDADTRVLYVAGKGDGNVRMYELTDDHDLPYLTSYTSSAPQLGLTFAARRVLDTRRVEIARAVKTSGTQLQTLTFRVPRTRTDFFQDDIYSPTFSGAPAYADAATWLADANTHDAAASVSLVSLCPPGVTLLSDAPPIVTQKKYVAAAEQRREEKQDVMSAWGAKMTAARETGDEPDQFAHLEGVDSDEWDDE